ncbi:MAG: ThuA domain-containing protein, partial [Phycisphaerae bacterium]|nr:ThuA domain-containing protein [Phycisphaerae bacterium]
MSAKAARRPAKAKKKKVLMLIGSPPFHLNEEVEPIVRPMLEGTGRWKVDVSRDLDLLAKLPTSDYAAVLIHTTGQEDELTGEREKGFFKFVESGGGVVGVHCASDSFRGNSKFVD